ncbi:transketolase [Candidatus Daviesbacteria bacterium RIFCSPLOWO2_02_FULL_40_8]|uniref:Transketolase n=1 Tax=Candidatus Daviesbacteria bacterium RIFCSPLOWO2_01_FULL_40_24 TaxID=1797787 RepID=A0A1F5MIH4_9BACT|nr:MAG: transketolase [Candidatus Daviesbacteria bacterium RIFCSPHIGHO2_01_FULL_41_45]OGE34179.1 MAG: transketolase [Candidatus Daviesbacteria bacterium RIFCSPHIGHO2_02_FULL_41_14]OGE65163.1 MAG: transketolase [Candidatus Daviesbacteria bacterium RIFCSPLOWO2_01_FULL_40_24]OGE66866.1 MAG: transketolase [Candidatus Daviesbacteria bacterium RIFCSPLOWO2_02_FULL_40_8]
MLNDQAHLNPKLFDDDIEQVPSRNGYGEGLVLAADANDQVVALCADLTESTRTEEFAKKYPNRFIEIGVAEQNLAAVASGMAAAGKVPFITSYAVFSPGRNWEQIRTTVCYNNQPVKIIGSHAGISVGPDGATHQALEDLAIMRALPNMVVVCPCDSIEAKKATVAIAKNSKPSYLRLSRSDVPVITTESTSFEIGKAEVFYEGKDVAIIACGQMVYRALLVAKELKEHGISIRVINNHTIKPLDQKTILKAAEETRAVVTVEEHQIHGGLGAAVAELISQNFPVPIKIIGIEDRFGESGEPEELLEKFGLTTENIKKAVLQVLRMKEK